MYAFRSAGFTPVFLPGLTLTLMALRTLF